MFLQKSATAFIAAFALISLMSAPSFAQSTPLPEKHDHDHSEAEDLPILPGAFSELPSDHVLGDQAAPTTAIIYASVTCPHCAYWFDTVWPSIKSNYVDTGKLRVVFREFPTAPAQFSFAGFLLANCAPADQYFPMIEHQMAEQSAILDAIKNGFAREAYLDIAKKAGMADEAAMNECLSDKTGIARIQNSLALARSAKVQSVPNFIIGGELYSGKSEYIPLSKYLDTVSAQEFSPIPKP